MTIPYACAKFLFMKTSQKIASISVSTALVVVMTIIVQIPIPLTEGYINVGDSIIFLTAILFGPIAGIIAGGIGSALADVISGYAHWALFTLLIKGLEGFVVGISFNLLSNKGDLTTIKTKLLAGLSMVFGCVIMVFGYYFAGWIMYGSQASSIMTTIPNLIQAGISFAIAFILLFAFNLKKIIHKSNE